jgi:hypothetical protein
VTGRTPCNPETGFVVALAFGDGKQHGFSAGQFRTVARPISIQALRNIALVLANGDQRCLFMRQLGPVARSIPHVYSQRDYAGSEQQPPRMLLPG